MKEYLTIGEVADIFQTSVQLLRHYDARGLLVPAIRDSQSKRRYYHFDQIYPLASIRYLRKLGYPLEQIEVFVSRGDLEENLESLTAQADTLQKHCQELLANVDIIQKKLRFIKEEIPQAQPHSFRIKPYPERQFLHVGEELNLFSHERFYSYPIVGFYQGDKKWFGAYLFGDSTVDEVLEQCPDTAGLIPAGDYFCGYHYGPYVSIQNSIDELFAAGRQQGYTLENCVVTLNIVDQFSEGHPDKYITALEARIIK